MAPSSKEDLKFLVKIFGDCQKSFACHNRHTAAVAERYKDKGQQLSRDLKPFLYKVLIRFKREPPTERCVKFLVKLGTCRANSDDWADRLSNNLIRVLLGRWKAKEKAVRFRVCEIVGQMLNEMDENAEIDEDLFCEIEEKMLIRMKDKIPQVRRSAAIALNRLQMPDDDEDRVMAALVHMMDHDSNKECRKEALIRLDVNKRTLVDMLRRVRDVSDQVRQQAFDKLHAVDLVSLTIQCRVTILKSGLTDRVARVKAACSKILRERWLAKRENKIIPFLKLLDVQNPDYEEDIEIILNHMFEAGFDLVIDSPPYTKELLSPEHLFYWRTHCGWLKKKKKHDKVDELMPAIKEFCVLIEHFSTEGTADEFMLKQLLMLALFLDFHDEFGRNELSKITRELAKKLELDNSLVKPILKLLRRCNADESEYIRLILEIVSDVRDPLEAMDEDPKEEADQKAMEERLGELDELRDSWMEKKRVAVSMEDYAVASKAKEQLVLIRAEIDELDAKFNQKDKEEQLIWERILVIVADLLEWTRKDLNYPMITPLLGSTLVPAISHANPCVRGPGIKAFGLYCLLSKSVARTNFPLMIQVLNNDQDALQFIALKCLFDFFLQYDYSGELAKPRNSENEDEVDEKLGEVDDDEDSSDPNSLKKVLTTMKEFLTSENKLLLQVAVEGFTKLLFVNRLPYYRTDILTRLFLLYFNPATEDNDHVRQCLSLFFPMFASNKSPNRQQNRKIIAEAVMPCLMTISYAPRMSPLRKISTSKLTEYILFLLQADPLLDKNAGEQNVPGFADTISMHEQIAFDVLYQIDANPNPAHSGVKTLARVLTILQLNVENQHNIRQYKILLMRIADYVEDKQALKYLEKFRDKLLGLSSGGPANELNENEIEELEHRRQKEQKIRQDKEQAYIEALSEGDSGWVSPVFISKTMGARRNLKKRALPRKLEATDSDEENEDPERPTKRHKSAHKNPRKRRSDMHIDSASKRQKTKDSEEDLSASMQKASVTDELDGLLEESDDDGDKSGGKGSSSGITTDPEASVQRLLEGSDDDL